VKPSTSNVAFWEQHAPAGVEIQVGVLGYTRSVTDTFSAGLQRAEQLAAELAQAGCGCVVVSGSPPFLLEGLDFERRWRQALSNRLGIPVVTGMEPHALALQALGAPKVAVATYYGDELNRAIASYFARFGIESAMLGGFSATGQAEGLYTTSFSDQGAMTAERVHAYLAEGVRGAGSGADALYINGAGWHVESMLTSLEQELGVPVVWGPVAEMWLAYHGLGIPNPQPDCGRLLSGSYAPKAGM
jgi:maleate cis-trans isomerase